MEKSNKVMIIDDDQTFIVPLEFGLKKKGIEVYSFTNPEEAIEHLKNNKIDLILTDYHMEPNINGDEVIRRIREFNVDIPIYLETAYAEDLPAEEMLDEYEIQGYIDKGEGQQKNIQLIKAGLKQSQLIDLVKNQKRQINALQYRDEFLGKFMYRLLGEIRERGTIIGGLVDAVTIDRQDYSEDEIIRFSQDIKTAYNKLMNMVETLEVEKVDILTIEQLKNTLNSLFEIKLNLKNIELNIINNINMNAILNCDTKTIIYILVDIIEFLIEENKKEINIEIEKEEKLKIKISNEVSSENVLEKIKILAEFDENIEIENNSNLIEIIIG